MVRTHQLLDIIFAALRIQDSQPAGFRPIETSFQEQAGGPEHDARVAQAVEGHDLGRGSEKAAKDPQSLSSKIQPSHASSFAGRIDRGPRVAATC
jgi:hypothetical protein